MALLYLGRHGNSPVDDLTTGVSDATICDGTVWWNDYFEHAQCKRCGWTSEAFVMMRHPNTPNPTLSYVYYLNPTHAFYNNQLDSTDIADPEVPHPIQL